MSGMLVAPPNAVSVGVGEAGTVEVIGAAAPGVVPVVSGVVCAPAPVDTAAIIAATAPTMIQFRFMEYSLGLKMLNTNSFAKAVTTCPLLSSPYFRIVLKLNIVC
jgi:hypothetical protein